MTIIDRYEKDFFASVAFVRDLTQRQPTCVLHLKFEFNLADPMTFGESVLFVFVPFRLFVLSGVFLSSIMYGG